MSCCHGSVAQGVRPGTARVLVTELSGSGHINPTPATKPCEDSETAGELYLSQEKLESLCGTRDLSHVTSLEICVDTQGNTLGNFGAYLPKLVRLKMNNSKVFSVRDLGTALSHLQVLWMSCCSLQDLDGISSLLSLKELYVAYNNVSELGPVGMLESLQLLDLEGNDVNDLVQVQYLGLCDKLQTLTLEGNPVCVRPNPTAIQTEDYSYRAVVRELVPQLCYLDDSPVEENGRSCGGTMGEDWAILRNSIRDCNSYQAATEDEEPADSTLPYSRLSSARRPASSHSCVWPLPSAGCRPMSACGPGLLSPSGSRPGSADTATATVDAETSTLTHGAGKIVFCGNPVQAVRARREKLRTAPIRSTFAPRHLPIHVPEHTYDLEEPDVRERVDVFAELRAWREQHSRRLHTIETERLPQVLSIRHSDEEDLDDDDDDDHEEDFGAIRNYISDEECGEGKHGDSLDTVSLYSSLQTLSPDLYHTEDTALSHSSPSLRATTAVTGHRKLPGIRARRLRLSHTGSEHLPDLATVGPTVGAGISAGDTNLTFQRVKQQLTRTKVPLLPPPAHKPRPPPTSALGKGLMDSSAQMDLSSVKSGLSRPLRTPQMSKLLDRPLITRPHTARAALQTHHQQHNFQPCRGSSHPH